MHACRSLTPSAWESLLPHTTVPAPPNPTPPWPYPLWIAHRGAGKLAPENTLLAFREGARLGFSMFECDVKLSRDGVPFLLHDDDLDRTTNATGPAAALDWSALSLLDAGSWSSPAGAGEPPASLEGLARFLIANQLAVNLELKPNPGQARLTGERVAAAVERLWAGQTTLPLLSSFEPDALRGAAQAAPQLPRALLLERFDPHWLTLVRELGCVAVVAHFSALEQAWVEAMHNTGLKVMSYTVNDVQEAQRLLELGVCGLISDWPLQQQFGPRSPPA